MSASGVQEYHESMGEDLQRAAVILVGVLTKVYCSQLCGPENLDRVQHVDS